MEKGTVTISIEEFDRLRNLESDILKLPSVRIWSYEDRRDRYYVRIDKILYTTDVSQKEMLDEIQAKIYELEKALDNYKMNERTMLENFKIQESKYDELLNNCCAVCSNIFAWLKYRKVYIKKYQKNDL